MVEVQPEHPNTQYPVPSLVDLTRGSSSTTKHDQSLVDLMRGNSSTTQHKQSLVDLTEHDQSLSTYLHQITAEKMQELCNAVKDINLTIPTDMAAYTRDAHKCSVISLLKEMFADEGAFEKAFTALTSKVKVGPGTLGRGNEACNAITRKVNYGTGIMGYVFDMLKARDVAQLATSVTLFAYNSDPLQVLDTLCSKPLHLEANPKSMKSISGKKLVIGNNTFGKSDVDTLDGKSWLNDKVAHSYLESITGRAARSDGVSVAVLPCFVPLAWDRGQYGQFLYPEVSLTWI